MIVQAVCSDGASRPGIIQAANADGSYAVRWLSGSTSDVEPHEIEQVSGKFTVGDAVQAWKPRMDAGPNEVQERGFLGSKMYDFRSNFMVGTG